MYIRIVLKTITSNAKIQRNSCIADDRKAISINPFRNSMISKVVDYLKYFSFCTR